MISLPVIVHVGAGSLWLIATVAIAWASSTPRWLAAVQIAAALVAIFAGIDLWHARHAGAQGPVEHWLTVGSVCALIALGLQLPISIPALVRSTPARLPDGARWLARASGVVLAGAAIAMVSSLYA